LPNGRKRAHIEVYSNQRFMTMTGDVVPQRTIMDRNDTAQRTVGQMGGNAVSQQLRRRSRSEAGRRRSLLRWRSQAANGDKFVDLWHGRWHGMYSSQSEADFALVDIIAFYTQHVEQVVRLFRMSALGQRIKAQRTDYMNYMVRRAFDRMLPPMDFDGLKNQLEDELRRQREAAAKIVNPFEQPTQALPSELAYVPMGIPEVKPLQRHKATQYDRPPGLLGELATFIYAQAPRPVAEIALAGAVALMAGICGRSYNVSGMGLNQYVMLIADTGTGKEAIAGGDGQADERDPRASTCRERVRRPGRNSIA
jgi:hypothetical protein